MFQVSVNPFEFAEALAETPDAAMDVFADLANQQEHVGDVIQKFSNAHSCSEHHCTIAPFLRQLADALEAVEADL